MAAVNRPFEACPPRISKAQPARPAPTPVLADRATVATASVRQHSAVIGTSQPNVMPTARADAAEAARPSPASRPNTASARTSSTMRSLTAKLRDSSHAGSMPGPAPPPSACRCRSWQPLLRPGPRRWRSARAAAATAWSPAPGPGPVSAAAGPRFVRLGRGSAPTPPPSGTSPPFLAHLASPARPRPARRPPGRARPRAGSRTGPVAAAFRQRSRHYLCVDDELKRARRRGPEGPAGAVQPYPGRDRLDVQRRGGLGHGEPVDRYQLEHGPLALRQGPQFRVQFAHPPGRVDPRRQAIDVVGVEQPAPGDDLLGAAFPSGAAELGGDDVARDAEQPGPWAAKGTPVGGRGFDHREEHL